MFTQQALNDFKDFIDRNIVYAYVTLNGNRIKHDIHKKERLTDGKVAIYLQITPEVQTTVQKVELHNKSGQLWIEKEENIVLDNARNGVLYRFVFDIKEDVSNV